MMLMMIGARTASESGTKQAAQEQQSGHDLGRLQQREEVTAGEQRAGEGRRARRCRRHRQEVQEEVEAEDGEDEAQKETCGGGDVLADGVHGEVPFTAQSGRFSPDN